MNKCRNEKGSSNIEIILLLTAVIIIGGMMISMGGNLTSFLSETFAIETAQEEEVVEEESTVDAFTQLDKDAFVFLGDAGFMTTDEKRIAGSELLSQIDLLLTQAESAELTDTVVMLKDYQSKIESELNYGV